MFEEVDSDRFGDVNNGGTWRSENFSEEGCGLGPRRLLLPELLCDRKTPPVGTIKFSLGPAVSSSKMYWRYFDGDMGDCDTSDGDRGNVVLFSTGGSPRLSYRNGAILFVSESERSERGDRGIPGVREYLGDLDGVVGRCDVDMARGKQA